LDTTASAIIADVCRGLMPGTAGEAHTPGTLGALVVPGVHLRKVKKNTHDGGRSPVDEEVVPLDCRAERARQGDASGLGGLPRSQCGVPSRSLPRDTRQGLARDIPMRNALIGLVVAVVLALSFSGASIFGIAVWKIALAAVGAVIFRAGRNRP
jgi:hypothetical protein